MVKCRLNRFLNNINPAGRLLALTAWACLGANAPAFASLGAYDAAVTADAGAGMNPAARLTTPAVLDGNNRVPFNFGATSGDASIEFILEGDPAASTSSAYLAVGTNTASSLRYEQHNNTGQLGFTQIGVFDYLFTPVAPSPAEPAHIVYVWDATARTMRIYYNGSLAGTRSGVSSNFSLPRGQGWLGANSSNGERMTGTIYRVTVYDEQLPEAMIQRHADAYNDVVHLPIIVSFTATPPAIFTPNSAMLTWQVEGATGMAIDGVDVTAQANLSVAPTATRVYTLTATNQAGQVTAQTTVQVNPAPEIIRFSADKTFLGSGELLTLSWETKYGQFYSITPEVGNVTAATVDGSGSIGTRPNADITYTLTVENDYGTATAQMQAQVVQPATHPVISEFMADDESMLADEEGQYSGWIEIYNPTATAISLAGHYLTDNESDPTQWALPAVTLAPQSFLLVFASGKDRANPTGKLHTNFRLNDAGEYLALVGPGPRALHAFDPAFPPQREGISYGLLGGDPGTARFMGIPTPGTDNIQTEPPPAEVTFSRPSGLFTNTFALALTTITPGAEIRYTVNGTNPNATNGRVYASPIMVTNTTRIRATAIAGGQASRVTGVNFIKLAPELANYSSPLPILVIENFGAGVIPQKGWSGDGSGITQKPRQSAVWATFERADGTSSLANPPQMFSTIGIRGRGAFSSQWRQKPYSVEAMDEYGEETKVDPLGMPAHADWILYFPDPDDNKDPAMFFNTFAYELSRSFGHDAPRFRWVEAFVNEDGGELRLADRRGVYAIMEKVSRGSDRLDFQPLSADGKTGGWLLNLNRMDPEPETGWPAPNGATRPWFFHTAGPNRILQSPPNAPVVGDDEPQQSNGFLNFDNPNGYTINANQRAAIELWFKQFEDVLWNNALWRDPTNGYRKYIEVRDFVEYFILNVLTRNGDGLLISMFPWKGDDNKLRMGPAWDYNWSAYFISGGPTGDLMFRSDRLWYRRLFTDLDFQQDYIDRWWELRAGPLSNAAMDAIIDRQMADITPEKAVLNGVASPAAWISRLTQMKTWLKNRADWIDTNYIPPPTFKVPGGEVPDGFQVVLSGAVGTLYVTTDGSDPRAPGGSVAPSAFAYAGPIALSASTHVRARVKNGTKWSGLASAVFYTPQDLADLAVTEIHYNPPAFQTWGSDDLEFLELKNTGAQALRLGTMTFTAGISFTFTNGTVLEPGRFFVLARNAAAFQAKYPGVPVNGIYTGRLDNGGETIRLATQLDNTVFSVTYNDRAPWPLAADGHGFSAVPLEAGHPDNSDKGSHWRASALPGGSPGADDPPPSVPIVVINEVLTRTDLPQVDALELFNPTAQPVDIGGWFLSDDGATPKKFRIPEGTILPAGGYRVFTEADFNPATPAWNNFALGSTGDAVYLCSGDTAANLTGYSHGISFGAAASGVSFGRYVNQAGEEFFPAQLANTLGAANAGPVVGPVVIQEIMYHPDAEGEEFIELRNLTGNSVPLYDPARPTNTWRINGLGYDLPAGITLPPHGLVLVAGGNPAEFRVRYSVPESVQVLGPYAGSLQDSGEQLELQRPEIIDTNSVAYITVDGVRYSDKSPWPPGADGGGPSLQRKQAAAYGNEPANWQAALPTPGADLAGGEAPVIVAHPSDQTIVAYQRATFSVSAIGGEPLYYQWLFNGDPLLGETNSMLLLTNAAPDQAGRYHAVVYNAAGSSASAEARLTLLIPAVILKHPANVTTNAGRTVTFAVSAIGTGLLRYQWEFNGIPLPNATNATLVITNIQMANTGSYRVTVRDDIGVMVSTSASLNILVPPYIIEHPLSQSVATGTSVTLSVVVTNTATLPVEYLWRTNNKYFLTNVLRERTAFLTITNARPPFTNYTVVVRNAAQPGGINSNPALLTFLVDVDGDGMPDEWETAHGLNKASAADRSLDLDGDGALNWQEYVAGTDPANAASYLKVELSSLGATPVIAFGALPEKTYTIQYTDAFARDVWHKLADVPARSASRVEYLHDPAMSTNRFYRVVTPRQP